MADETLEGSVLECRSLPSAEERLMCYDGAVDDHAARRAGAAASPRADATANTAPSAATATAEASFGLPPLAEQPEKIKQMEATIAELSTTASGRLNILLDNGQTWQQRDVSTMRISEGDEIVIRRRSLGSHTLSKAGTSRTMKVKRLN